MKRTIVSVVLLLLLCGMADHAAAEVQTTVSVKTWVNSWKQKFTDTLNNQSETVKSESAVPMVGPALTLKFDKTIFIGVTYLTSLSDYEFKSTYTDPFAGVVNETDTNDRQDLDLVAGYMFNPNIGLFVGYKKITSEGKFKADTQFFGQITGSFGSETLTGPGIGILGNVPLGESVILYGNIGYLKLKDEFKDAQAGTTETSNLTGYVAELGFAFIINTNFSANVGYKHQAINSEEKNNQKVENTFSGLTAGINYTF